MAGQLTGNGIFNFIDYSAGYISVVLGRCALISLAVFAGILLLRGTVLKGTCFLRGLIWGFLFITLFLGKLKVIHGNGTLAWMFRWWDALCIEHWWARHGYLAGIVLGAGAVYQRRRRLGRLVLGMGKKTVRDQEVYLNELPATPFSVGLIFPKIVIPRRMEQGFTDGELRLILLHEQVHIRLGHLWFYLAWDLCRVILWMNPLFILCRDFFQEDLENICDRITIQRSGGAFKMYGEALLKCMRELKFAEQGAEASFGKWSGYGYLKRRFVRIAGFEPYGCFRVRVLALGGAAVLAGVLLTAWMYSFPRYTEIRDVILVDELQGQRVFMPDSEQLRRAVSWDGSRVYIDCEALDVVLCEYQYEGEGFWLRIGGYTKIPSMGGGGSIVYVDYQGHGKELSIPYCNQDGKPEAVLLKWMM